MDRKCILLAISLILSVGGLASSATSEEQTNYCKDVAGWDEWHGLIEKYPEDDAIHALYATRLGLCSMVEMGNISLERAITIFDNMKESVIDQRKKEAETKEKNQKQGT